MTARLPDPCVSSFLPPAGGFLPAAPAPRLALPQRLPLLGLEVLARLAPAMARRALWRLWFTPQSVPPNARARELMASADSVSLARSGLHAVRLMAWGRGPLVVLAHGWSGYGGQLGSFVPPLVASGHRVLLFDAPGHGGQPATPFTLEDYARLLTGVLAGEDVQAVIAHSLGATAAALALSRLASPAALVAVAPTARLDTLVQRFRWRTGVSARIEGLLRAVLEAEFGASVWQAYSLAGLLPVLAGPVLLVHDRDDAEADVANSLCLQRQRPDAALFLTAGLGHNRLLHDPAVQQQVQQFLGTLRA